MHRRREEKMTMKKDLTTGDVSKSLLAFAGPMILGNLLQQCYNIADTFIVGRFLGADALAAVGAAYTLMTFLTSILIGLCMGSSSLFSLYFGRKDRQEMKNSISASFLFISLAAVLMNVLLFLFIDEILRLLSVPETICGMMRSYVWIIFFGIFPVFLYNFFAFVLRSVGNSALPLWFLGIASAMNIILDYLFVVSFRWGIEGAAIATVAAQIFAGAGNGLYVWIKERELMPGRVNVSWKKGTMKEVVRFSLAASVQQSVMNFGILMIQGLVNSFGTVVMAAFAAAVKVDSFAYMPAQEYGNAFSIFISQNHGAGEKERIRKGTANAVKVSAIFCVLVSVAVFLLAPYLMMIFISPEETEVIRIGVGYLRVEGSFYVGIGILFLLYGFYRGIGKPEMSVVLTVISLGTRVLLAYVLAPIPAIGVWGIWWAIPIGWFLADVTGFLVMSRYKGG